MKWTSRGIVIVALTIAAMLLLAGTAFAAVHNALVSVASDGTKADAHSEQPAISHDYDGRYVAFASSASNLVADDDNGHADIFRRDRETGETILVSVSTDGVHSANAASNSPTISDDGRYVAFVSGATDLVASDPDNGWADIFLYDCDTGDMTLISVGSGGAGANGNSANPSISGDGSLIAFDSAASNLDIPSWETDGNAKKDIFVSNWADGFYAGTCQMLRVTHDTSNGDPDGDSENPEINQVGTYIVFESDATDLIASDLNGDRDVFICTIGGLAERISVDSDEGEVDGDSYAPTIGSGDQFVAFSSDSADLVADDDNGKRDIFVRDRSATTTVMVSVASDGTIGNDDSNAPSFSTDGSKVAFASNATNLVDTDDNTTQDIFVHVMSGDETVLASVCSDGTQANGLSNGPSLNYDGSRLAFASHADNLSGDDTNIYRDILVAELDAPEITQVSPDFGSTLGGNYVDIYGTGFTDIQKIMFGDTEVSVANYYSSEWISVYAPAHAAGTVRIVITTAKGTSPDNDTDDYTYAAPPVVTDVTPDTGPSAGGGSVTITGENFIDVNTVLFGGATVTDYDVVSETQIDATIPPWWWGGQVDVTVFTPYGISENNGELDDFTFSPPAPSGDLVTQQLTADGREKSLPEIDGDRVVWTARGGSDGGADFEVFTMVIGDTTPTQITEDDYEAALVQVSGDRVVWQQDEGSGFDIFTWTPEATSFAVSDHAAPYAGGILQVTDNTVADEYPQVSGDRIVWQRGETMSLEIYTWTPGGGEHKISDNSSPDCLPQVDGDRVVWQWQDPFGGVERICTWKVGDSAPTILTAGEYNQYEPKVSGERVVWYGENADGIDADIYTCVVGGSIVRLLDNDAYDVLPSLCGDRVAWESYSEYGTRIYTWTPTGGVQLLADYNGLGEFETDVSGDRVVWFGFGTGELPPVHLSSVDVAQSVDFAKAHSGQAASIAGLAIGSADPSVANGVVVNGFVEVATWTPSEGNVRLTNNTLDDVRPRVSGDNIVWLGGELTGSASVGDAVAYEEYGAEIYLATPPKPVITTPTRYEQKDGRIFYTGDWHTSSYLLYSGGNQYFTFDKGASAYIPFWGTRLDWITKTSRLMGIAGVQVDGGAVQFVNLYSSTTKFQKKVWSTGELDYGLHWVRIICSGIPSWGGGTAVDIDALDIWGQMAWATRYQQEDSKLKYVNDYSGWRESWSWSYSGFKQAYANAPGNSVTIRFDGAALNIVGTKARSYGKAWVSVDGGPRQFVDFYRYSAAYKQVVWSTGYLAPGEHTIEISWSGYKNWLSRGYSINLDAVDVLGELLNANST